MNQHLFSDETAHALVRKGQNAGLLPASAVAPALEQRPWPLVLLTALGAWLSAVPLMAAVGLLLGDIISRSVGPYLVGLLMLAAAMVVLRARDVPVFVEQLAIPILLAGGGALGFGLFRDLSPQVAAVLLCALALGLAALLQRAWLCALLGAAVKDAGGDIDAARALQGLSRRSSRHDARNPGQ